MNVDVMDAIQHEKEKEIEMQGNPTLDAEGNAIMSKKRIAIDQPNLMEEKDPLR